MNPIPLLQLEWKKYLPSGTFRVIAALYAGSFILILFLAYLCRHMIVNMNGVTGTPFAGFFVYPHNWEVLATIGSWMNMFLLGFLGVAAATIEFSNRTLRQSVIFGLTRLEAAVSKLVWALALALAASAFYILLGLAAEALNRVEMRVPPAESTMRFFLQALGYLILGNLVGLLIRKTPLAELAYLAYVMILEFVGRWIFYLAVAKTHLLLYLPNQVLGALTSFSVSETVGQIVQSTAATKPLSPLEATVAALVYICLFAALFCWRIVKSDL